MDIAPWFASPLEAIQQQFNSGKLAHAILLKMQYRLDVHPLLNAICQTLRQQENLNFLEATDVYYLTVEQSQIKLDGLKEVVQHLTLNSHSGKCKIVIIDPAEAMNTSATNAILKTLEEPRQDTYFFLVTYHAEFLLPTIQSRVQVVDIHISKNQAMTYLREQYQMNDADISKAMTLTRQRVDKIIQIKADKSQWQLRTQLIKALLGHVSITDFAEQYKLQIQDVLFWLSSLLCDVYLYQCGAKQGYANVDQMHLVMDLAQRQNQQQVYSLYQQTLKIIGLIGQHYNVNMALSLESLLLKTQQGK